jgi:pimeloyl-ACP methyl ester carboxylesterase
VVVAEGASLEQMVDHLLDSVAGPLHLVGHSLGGWVVQAAAAAAPERIQGLVLIDTWTTAPASKLADLRHMREQVRTGQRDTLLAGHRPLVFYARNPQYEACQGLLETMHRSFPTALLEDQLDAMIADNATGHLLPRIRTPTLVVHGRHDPWFGLEEARALAAGIEGARLVVVEDAAHGTPIEQPQAVTALLALWLGGL